MHCSSTLNYLRITTHFQSVNFDIVYVKQTNINHFIAIFVAVKVSITVIYNIYHFFLSYKLLGFTKNITFASGEVAEWSNAAVLKTVDLHGSGGSNPSFSARLNP
jgi:hypothetical protein